MNIYVEKKNEFTINIINILYPLINEGINTIYNKAKEVSKKENVLKMFQTFLKRIPKWQDETLTLEINRIKTNCTDFDLLNNLIKAAIKSNITILTYSPYKNNKINPEFYNKFDFKKFIHNIYIEIARELWNNPYLYYHCYEPIELKKNQRESQIIIKNCIEESIRKLLPLKFILNTYLDDKEEDSVIENTITEVDKKNLNKILNNNFNELQQGGNELSEKPENSENSEKSDKVDKSDKSEESRKSDYSRKSDNSEKSNKSEKFTKSEKISSSKNSKNIDSQILNIINNDNLNLTSEKMMEHKKNLSETSSENIISSNMDSNLKKIINDDLNESETESVTNFKPEISNNKYQEIFSNSDVEKNENINKNKFFNNYLQFGVDSSV